VARRVLGEEEEERSIEPAEKDRCALFVCSKENIALVQGLRFKPPKTASGRLAHGNVSDSQSLFRSEIFLDFDTVTLLFLFNKHCPIIE